MQCAIVFIMSAPSNFFSDVDKIHQVLELLTRRAFIWAIDYMM